jgi:hypothetical protein
MAAPKTLKDAKRRTVWFPDDLWGRMVKAANADERTVSSWLRKLAEKALSR